MPRTCRLGAPVARSMQPEAVSGAGPLRLQGLSPADGLRRALRHLELHLPDRGKPSAGTCPPGGRARPAGLRHRRPQLGGRAGPGAPGAARGGPRGRCGAAPPAGRPALPRRRSRADRPAARPPRLGPALPGAEHGGAADREGQVPALPRGSGGSRGDAYPPASAVRAGTEGLAAEGAGGGRAAPGRAAGGEPALRRPGRRPLRPAGAGGGGAGPRARRLGRADHAPRRPPAAGGRADLHPRGPADRGDRPGGAGQRRAADALRGGDAAALRRPRGGRASRRRDRRRLPLLLGRAALRVPAGDLGRRGSAGAAEPADRRRAALALSGRRARPPPRPGRARAGADRAQGIRPLLPDRARRGRLCPEPGHPLPGPGLGGELDRLLRARHHRDVAGDRHHGLRALRLRRPRRAARHRRRLRARAARGGDPVHLPPLRARAGGALRHGDPLSRQAGDPRGGRGHGPVARHGGGAFQPDSGAGGPGPCRASGWSSWASTPTSGG